MADRAGSIGYDLQGEDLVRFVRYEKARSLQQELRAGAKRGKSAAEIAESYGLVLEDVEMVLYALQVRSTARV